MKTKNKRDKKLMEKLREIRDRLSQDIQDMTFEELKEYLKQQKKLRSESV